jgi:phospho-N-acetylmuramoyl-pentapeptide-transferase
MILNILKVFGLGALSFFVGLLLTPPLTHYLYKYKLWRKEPRKFAPDGSQTPIFNNLHQERETTVPRMGGILVWVAPLFVILLFRALIYFFPSYLILHKLNFLSRFQTWLPLFTLIAASLVGLADDFFQVFGRGKYIAGGVRFSRRLILIILIAAVGAWWFYFKLEQNSVFVPFWGKIVIGPLFPFFFILVMIATFSGGVIDGLDGLAGGVLASSFSAYAGIAFFQNQIDLATFAAVTVGALLAFLWFNIPPARFYMGESGIMGLTTSLTVLAFLTDSVLVLPIIALPLVLASGSSLIQLLSKRFLGRKIFIVAPLHHHLEALGWPPHKITMRFWIIGIVFAVVGMIIALAGK